MEGEPVDEAGLTEAEQKKVETLQERDREVRRHEQAHVAAGGGYASQPTYRFVQGPDGRSYAVAGEVKIDTSPIPGNPEATIRKMEVVKRAALAPEQPSSQDRRVAAQAEAAILKARREKSEEDREEAETDGPQQAAGQAGIPEERAVFDPERRFRAVVGGTGEIPSDPGLAGTGGLDLELGLLEPGELFNLTA